jgi:uncharacterized protein (DUF302 family)
MTEDRGIHVLPSVHSVDETVRRATESLRAKGVKLFAVIDHDGEAHAALLQMRPTKLLIFGSPAVGTQLMIASPSIAIDLPLNLLIWEDQNDKVWISHNESAYLQTRHGVPTQFAKVLAGIEALTLAVSEEAGHA